MSSEDGGRVWRPVTTITTSVEVDQAPSGIVCDESLRCLIGIATESSSQNAALYINVATRHRSVRYFPAGPYVLPLGGPVCHGHDCYFFVQWHGALRLAPAPFLPRSLTP
jgi:hypothetical protein